MEYNTQRDHLVIPEYGRNLQKIVNYAITVENRDKRNQIANLIVDIMAQLHSQTKDSPELRHKLWDHLHIIADFQLDVDSPFPMPDREVLSKSPNTLSYPKKDMKYRYYGKNMEGIIKAAVEEYGEEDKEKLALAIANILKKYYLTWNRDSVDDDLIKKHLNDLSGNALNLKPNQDLTSTVELIGRPKKNNQQQQKKKSTPKRRK
jgi:hypothetical protein